MARKNTAPVAVVSEEEDDELDVLDEEDGDEAAAEATPKRKRAKKAKADRPAREGKSTREAAEALGITPVRLRRILRTDDFMNDGGYTRYDLSDEIIERVRAVLAAGAEEKPKRGRKSKAASVEDAADEATAELDDLGEDEDDEDIDLEEDEEEEE